MSSYNGQDEAARLEAALERIAHAASRPRTVPPQTDSLHATAPDATTSRDTAEIAARLDSLIAELRAVLGPQAP